MSNIYTESKIICPCLEGQRKSVNYNAGFNLPMNIAHRSTTHDLSNLFFCPKCMEHKCKERCQVNVESKFCSNCMSDLSETKETVCTKNCFSCPLCDAGLAISAIHSRCDDKDGKVFKFKCFHCDYRYSTATILKPRSLASIIRSEKKQKDNGFTQLFVKLYDNYVNKQNLMKIEKNQDRRRKNVPHLTSEMLQKFRDLNLANLTDSVKDSSDEVLVLINKIDKCEPMTFDENQDLENSSKVSRIHKLNDFANLDRQAKNSSFNSTLNNGSLLGLQDKLLNSESPSQVPVPKKLTSKKSYRCLTCQQILLMPNKEPALIKFSNKWNAIDFTPSMKVSSLINMEYPKVLQSENLYNVLLNIINPLKSELDMVISTIPKIPLELVGSSQVNIALPVSHIVIGGSSHKKDPNSIIKSIPTPFLSKETKLSRAELIIRLGKLNSIQNSTGDSLEMSDINIDQGANWCLIPVSFHVESFQQLQRLVNIKVPFYIVVKSKLPDSLQELRVLNLHLSYGYWTVIDFGSFLVQN